MALVIDRMPLTNKGDEPLTLAFEGRKQWLEIRKKYIGASESATLLGYGMFSSPYALYMEKTNQAPDTFTDNTRMAWGRRLEASIRDGIAEDLGYDPQDCLYGDEIYVYKEGPERLGCTPDAVLAYPNHRVHIALGDVQGPGCFEVKNVDGIIHKQKWTEDEPPVQYLTQLQHQLAVTGYEWGVLGALVGGNKPMTYFYRRHEPTIQAIKSAALAFWEAVDQGKPPAIDDSQATEKTIKAMHPRDNGADLDLSADNELPQVCADFLAKKKAYRELDKEIRGLKSQIMEKLGDARTADVLNFSIKAPTTEVEGYWVEARTQRTLTVKEKK